MQNSNKKSNDDASILENTSFFINHSRSCFNLNEHKLQENKLFKVFVYNSLHFRQCARSYKVQVTSPYYMRHGMGYA